MIERGISVLTLLSALGCGLVAGVFFAFSSFAMKALGRIAPACGISAMQSINVAVPKSSFLLAFLGTAAACLVLAVSSIVRWAGPGSGYRLAGSLLYLLGTLLVTMVFNVPRNNALAATDPGSDEGATTWARYLASWTAWNHVRTAAALAAAALLTLAFGLPSGGL